MAKYRILSQSRITGHVCTEVSWYGELIYAGWDKAIEKCRELDLFFPYFKHTPNPIKEDDRP